MRHRPLLLGPRCASLWAHDRTAHHRQRRGASHIHRRARRCPPGRRATKRRPRRGSPPRDHPLPSAQEDSDKRARALQSGWWGRPAIRLLLRAPRKEHRRRAGVTPPTTTASQGLAGPMQRRPGDEPFTRELPASGAARRRGLGRVVSCERRAGVELGTRRRALASPLDCGACTRRPSFPPGRYRSPDPGGRRRRREASRA